MNRKKIIGTSFILLVFCFHAFSQERKTNSKNHLFIKTDVLSPLLALITPEDDFIVGISFEYKIKYPWSVQINGNYYNETYYYKKTGFQITPEARYFFHSHQFSGLYFKYDQQDQLDYPISHGDKSQKIALGILYGYQTEVGRWIFEGRIGLGINRKAKVSGIFGTGNFEFSDSSLKMDTILAFNIGWRIV